MTDACSVSVLHIEWHVNTQMIRISRGEPGRRGLAGYGELGVYSILWQFQR